MVDDFYEIDLLDVETTKSGDAICLRYSKDGKGAIHVVDAGYLDTGDKMIGHIERFYGRPAFIDHVVVTHPDGDHAAGIRKVVDHFEVGSVWMLRPWKFVDELLPRFDTYTSRDRLIGKLRSTYTNLAAIEEICEQKGIPIRDPFQGATIGAFAVAAPTRSRYLDLVVTSQRTPSSSEVAEETLGELLAKAAKRIVNYVKAGWGFEAFSPEPTSAENNMSVVQAALIAGHKIVLTGDAGREGLAEAADYLDRIAPAFLPGVDIFQVPHHGSRRNLTSELLDRFLGPKLQQRADPSSYRSSALISSAKADTDHPRKTVLRACIHRGARVLMTEGQNIAVWKNPPRNRGWGPLTPAAYPEEMEQ